MNDALFVGQKAIELSKLVLKMTTSAGSGHPSSALSLAHIVTSLMYICMRWDPDNPWNKSNDRIILSEGHAVPIIYAAAADLNVKVGTKQNNRKLTTKDLDKYRTISSELDGHPNPSSDFPLFDCATGSLGQGLSCACGLASGCKHLGIENYFYTIIGDGEAREGQIWEACDFLVDYKLFNVIPVFNCNGMAQSDPISPQQSIEKLHSKLNAYGFSVETIDGHNCEEVLSALQRAKENRGPSAIVAKTVKGWGVTGLSKENHHGKPLKESQLTDAYKDLDSLLPHPSSPVSVKVGPRVPKGFTPLDYQSQSLPDPDFQLLLKDDPTVLATIEKGILSTRRAYGLALRELGRVDQRVVALDADVKNSTFSEYFAKTFPDRFYECRIAEQNMVSVAAGLAATGLTPFISSFAKFITRAYDQFELAMIAQLPLKMCGSHSGLNVGADGPSQMGLSDLAYMRAFSTVKNKASKPLLTIFNPSCAVCAYKCVELMNQIEGACYLRSIRTDLPILYSPQEEFKPGGAKFLRIGRDLIIISSGFMVHECIKAADKLEHEGIEVTLIDCYSFPVDKQVIRDALQTGSSEIVTVEDNLGNSLGAEIASIVASDTEISAKVTQLHAQQIPPSGSTKEVLRFAGLELMDRWYRKG
ncbi:transketolase [Chitinispirillales bacterium ANBcel5]|uniref:transketolase n=1 Tax=Cellulosispirillum alkaliphilum TaxID=3039283 RepID=UPI002A578AEE|nr:transketolase [Chitinispirillales bacterium ANBcel5]